MTTPLDPPPPPSEHDPTHAPQRVWMLWLPAALLVLGLLLFVVFLVQID